jgi:hypothetical protein
VGTHFRPLPFPSENFGGCGKKVYGRPGGPTFAEIRIVNAGKLKSDKVLSIKRDHISKITGATVMNAQ